MVELADEEWSGDELESPAVRPDDELLSPSAYSNKESAAWCWWHSIGSPRLVLAPMVDASELAWRMLARRMGAQLCYTPMLHAAVFARDPKYRRDALASCPEDRPLIVQLCGNCPEQLVEAALLAQDHCDAVDVNLGCPQAIARRGHYGAFLQDDWDLLKEIIGALRQALHVPVTAKIRIFADVERTVQYARALEAAGAQMLAVHGRTRDQRGAQTGLASWEHIAAVADAVHVPVIANGNIRCAADARRCLLETRAAAVMSAEGHLRNPAIFASKSPAAWRPALAYLRLVRRHPCPSSVVRGHLFKLFHHCLCLPENESLRSQLATASSLDEFSAAVRELRKRYYPFHEGLASQPWQPPPETGYDLVLPPWICQPYLREPEKINAAEGYTAEKENEDSITQKRSRESSVESVPGESKSMSKRRLKKMRKLMRKPDKVFHARRDVDKCAADCPNPMGGRCERQLCRACCRRRCYEEDEDCPGHRILTKTRRQHARQLAAGNDHQT